MEVVPVAVVEGLEGMHEGRQQLLLQHSVIATIVMLIVAVVVGMIVQEMKCTLQ